MKVLTKARSFKIILLSAFITAIIQGCASGPRYKFMSGDETIMGKLSDAVNFRVGFEESPRNVDCVAILPLNISEKASKTEKFHRAKDYQERERDYTMPVSHQTTPDQGEQFAYRQTMDAQDKRRVLRQMFYGYVAPHQTRDVELVHIDRVVGSEAPSSDQYPQIAEKIGCSWLLEGEITDFSVEYFGLYSNIRVGAHMRIVHATNGSVAWEGQHLAQSHAGAVPLTPMDVAMGVYKAATNVNPDQVERIAGDLARRLVRTMPLDNVGKTPAPVKSINFNGVYQVASNGLNMRKGPGTEFSVKHVLTPAEEVKMVSKSNSGRWVVVRTSDNHQGYVASRYLKKMGGQAASDEMVADDHSMMIPDTSSLVRSKIIKKAPKSKFASAKVTPGNVYEVTSVGLNMRQGPGGKFPVHHILKGSDEVAIIEAADAKPWVLVRNLSAGQEGYVSSYFLKEKALETVAQLSMK